jgi:acyl-coenzyme A thioesterase PaaI-like protein
MTNETEDQALQDRFAPTNGCFGCGPANEKGLRIRSFVRADEVVCEWRAKPHHQAFPGMVNGGICGALLDCHSNWTAAWHLMRENSLDAPPCTVTAEFTVKLMAPTPLDQLLTIRARVTESSRRMAIVEATIEANGTVTCTCRGVFIAVQEGHPAFNRW